MILPSTKALYLCDGHIGYTGTKTDLVGLFNSIRAASFPHYQRHMVVFAQLLGGLGEVPFHIDVRHAASDTLVRTTKKRLLPFPTRTRLVQLACTIAGCSFPESGTYLVELHCHGEWIADTTLELLLEEDDA